MSRTRGRCRSCGDAMVGTTAGRRFCYTCRPPIAEGYRHGKRVAVSPLRMSSGAPGWIMRCECGDESQVEERQIYAGNALSCRACNEPGGKPIPFGTHTPTLAPGSDGPPYHLNDQPYEDDPEAQRFVDEHPNGATLEEIAGCFGLTRERVRQLEARALAKLARNAEVLSAVRGSALGWGSTPPAGDTNHERTPDYPARGRSGQR